LGKFQQNDPAAAKPQKRWVMPAGYVRDSGGPTALPPLAKVFSRRAAVLKERAYFGAYDGLDGMN
jgi:hypothetical protein